jgi:hypothetical protein
VVSAGRFAAVSRHIEGSIGDPATPQGKALYQLDTALHSPLILSVEIAGAQYQRASVASDRRLMLRVGLGLGAVYLVFVGAWIWATRFRSRRPGH